VLQFRPVAVKQGTETNEPSLGSVGEMSLNSDEMRIEKYSLDEKQHQLRQAFVTRLVLMILINSVTTATTTTATLCLL